MVGDMNVHNERWLQFSSGESLEGFELERVCAAHSLKQHVKSLFFHVVNSFRTLVSPILGRNYVVLFTQEFWNPITCA